ncbi:MAG: hypothetical protein NTV65_04040 [Proteobacteria bacterium]|nr:hypothetical protein [Pseudomonadota bacterium]
MILSKGWGSLAPLSTGNTPAFFRDLNTDSIKREALYAGVYGLVVSAGKGDDKNCQKAIDHLYHTSGNNDSLFNNAVRLAHALTTCDQHFAVLRDFIAPLWQEGLDLSNRGKEVVVYDKDLAEAMISEGLINKYLLSPQTRPALKAVAQVMYGVLQETTAWRAGRPILDTMSPDIIGPHTMTGNPGLRDLTTTVLMIVHLARFNIIGQLSSTCHDKHDSNAYIGPTAWAANMLERTLMKEFFELIDPIESQVTLKLVGTVARQFHYSPYYLNARYEGFKRGMEAAKETGAAMANLEELLSEQKKLREEFNSTSILDALPKADESTRAYRQALPPYLVRYCNMQRELVGGVALLHLTTSSAAGLVAKEIPKHFNIMELFNNGNTTEDFVRWRIGEDKQLRSSYKTGAIPFIAEDLGVSSEQFTEMNHQIEERTLALMHKLVALWERYPGIYSARFGFKPGLFVVEQDNQLLLWVDKSESHILREALKGPRTSGGNLYYDTRECIEGSTFMIVLTVQETPPPPPMVVEIPNESICEIDNIFIAKYCAHFRDLARVLRSFNVTLENGGNGSHQRFELNGSTYTVSKNQRDGTLLIDRHLIRQILAQLKIDEAEFVSRVSRDRRTSATH